MPTTGINGGILSKLYWTARKKMGEIPLTGVIIKQPVSLPNFSDVLSQLCQGED
jgi:hypothetical protein